MQFNQNSMGGKKQIQYIKKNILLKYSTQKGLLVHKKLSLNFMFTVVHEFQHKEHVCYLSASLYTASHMLWMDFIPVRTVAKSHRYAI